MINIIHDTLMQLNSDLDGTNGKMQELLHELAEQVHAYSYSTGGVLSLSLSFTHDGSGSRARPRWNETPN